MGFAVALLVVLAQADAGAADAGNPIHLTRKPLSRPVDDARVERVLQSLDTRARAGQLLLAYPQVKGGPVEVGGVLFVGNLLRNPERARDRIESARARARVPPFVAVDMEGGPSNRMKSLKALRALPSAQAMAALSDAEVQQWGRTVGEAMRSLGLNLNLAPVFDVAKSGHMERNGRSFSGDPAIVVAKASAYSRGLLEAGVVPIGKHFPGYGDIDGDSDHALVTADWPKERVLAEADVFAQAKGVLGGVMLANVAYASMSGADEPVPAILSPQLVALAHQHDWLAVTDDVSIALLAESIHGTAEDVVIKAFLAGNDLLLTTAPPDWDKGLDFIGILTTYAETHPEGMTALEVACRRVLRLKDRMGLLDGR